MAEFRISVGDKEYTMEYTRDSIRQFEAMGGSFSGLQEKTVTSIDWLMNVGLMKHHPGIGYKLARKIADEAVEEYGISAVLEVLVDKFSEVFMQEGASEGKKSFLVSEMKSSKRNSD